MYQIQLVARGLQDCLRKITSLAYQHLGSLQEARFQETDTVTGLAAWMPKALRSPERAVLSSCLMIEYHGMLSLGREKITRPKDVLGGIQS